MRRRGPRRGPRPPPPGPLPRQSCAITSSAEQHMGVEGGDVLGGAVPARRLQPRAAEQRNQQLCTLCEEYTALKAGYLGANKTETEIIDTLHKACSRLHSYEQQCLVLVDYYAPLFFIEIAKIQPEEFCTKVNLCEEMMSISLLKRDDTCTLCHNVVNEVLTKLKDPDSQGFASMFGDGIDSFDVLKVEAKVLIILRVHLLVAVVNKILLLSIYPLFEWITGMASVF